MALRIIPLLATEYLIRTLLYRNRTLLPATVPTSSLCPPYVLLHRPACPPPDPYPTIPYPDPPFPTLIPTLRLSPPPLPQNSIFTPPSNPQHRLHLGPLHQPQTPPPPPHPPPHAPFKSCSFEHSMLATPGSLLGDFHLPWS